MHNRLRDSFTGSIPARVCEKLQISNSKLQMNSKSQIPTSKQNRRGDVWNLEFVWSLEFGIWSLEFFRRCNSTRHRYPRSAPAAALPFVQHVSKSAQGARHLIRKNCIRCLAPVYSLTRHRCPRPAMRRTTMAAFRRDRPCVNDKS